MNIRTLLTLLALTMGTLLSGCGELDEIECVQNEECASGICAGGQCVPEFASADTDTPDTGESDTSVDAGFTDTAPDPDATSDTTPDATPETDTGMDVGVDSVDSTDTETDTTPEPDADAGTDTSDTGTDVDTDTDVGSDTDVDVVEDTAPEPVCEPLSSWCEDDALFSCNSLGTDFFRTPCAEACRVDDDGDAACVDFECEAGTVICDEDNQLVVCDDEGFIEELLECGDEAVCILEELECVPLVCIPSSQYACAETVGDNWTDPEGYLDRGWDPRRAPYYICNEDGTGWYLAGACMTVGWVCEERLEPWNPGQVMAYCEAP